MPRQPWKWPAAPSSSSPSSSSVVNSNSTWGSPLATLSPGPNWLPTLLCPHSSLAWLAGSFMCFVFACRINGIIYNLFLPVPRPPATRQKTRDIIYLLFCNFGNYYVGIKYYSMIPINYILTKKEYLLTRSVVFSLRAGKRPRTKMKQQRRKAKGGGKCQDKGQWWWQVLAFGCRLFVFVLFKMSSLPDRRCQRSWPRSQKEQGAKQAAGARLFLIAFNLKMKSLEGTFNLNR